MEKEKKVKSVWFWVIGIILIMLIASVVAIFLLQNSKEVTAPGIETQPKDSISFTKLHDTTFALSVAQGNTVFTDEATFKKFWSEMQPLDANVPRPEVDFSRETVVAVSLGERESSCSKLDITAVKSRQDKTIVLYSVEKPGDSCQCLAIIENHLEIIKFDKTATPVEFEKVENMRQCNV